MNDRILVIDPNAEPRNVTICALQTAGFDVEVAHPDAAREHLEAHPYQAVLIAVDASSSTGFALCASMTGLLPNVPIVVLAARASNQSISRAFRAGAWDYLAKPFDVRELVWRLTQAICRADLRASVQEVNALRFQQEGTPVLWGKSARMRDVRGLVRRVADSDATLLLQGETGTGKELIARSVHAASARAAGPFVAVNCAAVHDTLLESEIFGHVRGAFTDATTDRSGWLMQAHGGTLFLDEIGGMSLSLQSKLLRVLQERRVRPVGGEHEIPFDVRVVAATHSDLEAQVEKGAFRQDLFYRLNVLRLTLPALRERKEDILELSSYFLDRIALRQGTARLRLSWPAAHALLAHDFPGNVRELESAMERACALARYDHVLPDDLPEALQRADDGARRTSDAVLTIAEMELRHIHRVLSMVQGNRCRAARLLKMDRRTLQRKLDRSAGDAGPPPPAPAEAEADALERPWTPAHANS